MGTLPRSRAKSPAGEPLPIAVQGVGRRADSQQPAPGNPASVRHKNGCQRTGFLTIGSREKRVGSSSQRRCAMRRICLFPAMLVMLLAVVPGTASAQGGLGAPDFKDRFTNEFVDEDFCGTGASVQVVESIVANVWEQD